MRNLNKIMKFGIVGVLNTAIDMLLFFTLWSVGMPYLLAQVLSYSAGTLNSFVWNRSWTFKASGQTNMEEITKFILLNTIALCMSTFLLSLLSGQPLFVSKTIATLSGLSVTFFGSRFWVFRQQRRKSI
ncbi:GtrA family protein [Domibacillus sp. DTU_2020_1001157_1_SI_ALB_TIR_016]|uniref:GtrA family protein n=1 Tax=Domibacillus sp. DTU_2020_1001157_1_SI_ALB_TIR_016 TaxID=3077789 RepID=UPI0028EA4B76|nr:GtrA family protein [Domibacillus sp. DTU_2020_1001157_1_SI_ALB_TIR_016]WNS81478.1 GtrA family protein [Domibacillus sp. DTU_2020_1001157_1_SI_ALB_TIR_016]